jgi:hypothetical protein
MTQRMQSVCTSTAHHNTVVRPAKQSREVSWLVFSVGSVAIGSVAPTRLHCLVELEPSQPLYYTEQSIKQVGRAPVGSDGIGRMGLLCATKAGLVHGAVVVMAERVSDR